MGDAFRSWSIESALDLLQAHSPARFAQLLQTGGATVEILRPANPTVISPPHDRDEFYVAVRGRGTLCTPQARQPLAPGDLAYVPAGMQHHFEDATDGFALWILYAGAPTPAKAG
jgi:mannose-6-phosphate isomerase-like protein (cupin superfamily)